ncbi:winged helix-turn-helix transcriptional regulator [Fusibacter sp. JL216-2]|uniref:winged helix-turn-helix transcriptional regulator n=1 Tax=Fusibacter sp. JL216-2 TaxID=3071453 RepID=UPI003D34AD8B
MLKFNNKKYVCHLDLAMDMIRGKWKAVLLCHLIDGPKRFLCLHRITGGISQKVLNENLLDLESNGLIHKKVYAEIPARVEYSLTDKGMDLAPIILNLQNWSKKYYNDIQHID